VLIDLTMPRMDGGEAFLEIQKIKNDVPVLLSSGFDETEILQRFDGYGLAGFISKPYKIDKLINLFKEVLGT